jgi:predicted glycoside hydrolase/deacetylase ChbG (UPF0249 family)
MNAPSTETPGSLIIVCDDAGFQSIDRGIATLAHATGAPVSAEYMITQQGALQLARDMIRSEVRVAIGLHFEMLGITDEARCRLASDCKQQGTTLGEQDWVMEKARRDIPIQLDMFRQELGIQPAHISTHGNFNTDPHCRVLRWWNDLMDEQFDGVVPPIQLEVPHVRHNLYSWNLPETRRAPRTPEEFGEELLKKKGEPVVELVLHPAMPLQGDAPIDMLFDEHMRVKDLWSAIQIIRSGIIEKCGFKIVPVSDIGYRGYVELA